MVRVSEREKRERERVRERERRLEGVVRKGGANNR